MTAGFPLAGFHRLAGYWIRKGVGGAQLSASVQRACSVVPASSESAVAQGPRPSQQRTPTAPNGGDTWAPAKPRPDETLIRALARAHRWKRLLEEGRYRSAAEIAEAEGITRSFVNRLLRLTLLTPEIVGPILDGRQRKGLQLAVLTGKLPSAWEEQRQLLPTTFARSA